MNQLGPTRPLSEDELRAAFDGVLNRTDPGGPVPDHPAPARTPSATPLDMAAMMGLDDRPFVERAYAELLGRRGDEPGVRHFVSALGRGHSRIMVLGELRYGKEGRGQARPVPGLARRFLLHRLYRLPLLGRVLRILTGIAALPGMMRDMTNLSAELRTLRAQTETGQQAIEQETRSRADAVDHEMRQGRGALREVEARLDKVARRAGEEPWADPLVALAERVEAQAERLDRLGAVVAADRPHAELAASLHEALSALREQLGWPERLADFARRLADELAAHRDIAVRAIARAEDNQAALHDQERRLSLLLGEVRGWMARRPEEAGDGAAARVESEREHLLDPLYVAFEDRFRGSRADIKQRQTVYLDLLSETGAGTPARPIVDVGSGRGELLEMLGEAGLAARGVDLNRSMVAVCAAAGLDCVEDDAVAYLSRLEPGSLGAVTGFHIIEHLPFPLMVALFDASLRALAPGGVVVFETPNPANLLVASRWFHLDPTHRNPLPGEMVAMIAEARGFVDVGIRELHPMQRRFEARDTVLAAQLDAIFHGPQDYALIARKPA